MPDVSIIIPCHNEGQNLYNTITSIRETTHDIDYEIIVVNDGSTDRNYKDLEKDSIKLLNIRRSGLAKAKNFGAQHAKADVLAFMDGHMKLHHDWLPKLLDTMEKTEAGILAPAIYDMNNPESKGYGISINLDLSMAWLEKKHDSPYEIPIQPGALKIMKKEIFNKLGKFDSSLKQWAPVDIEISMRAWLFGYSVFIDPGVEAGHLFKSSFNYDIDPVIYDSNIIRVALSHFNDKRLKKFMELLRKRETFHLSYLHALAHGALGRRYSMLLRRKFNDDWFFEKFGMEI